MPRINTDCNAQFTHVDLVGMKLGAETLYSSVEIGIPAQFALSDLDLALIHHATSLLGIY